MTCGTATPNVNSVEIPVIDAISAGDQLVVTVTNVTNPSTVATYSDFAVSTSVDSEAVDAPAYQIGVSSSVGVTVAVSPTTPGALATYTISGIHASAAISGGNQITISVHQRPWDRATGQQRRLRPDRLHDDNRFGWSRPVTWLQLPMTA